jgi:hypothetical protein
MASNWYAQAFLLCPIMRSADFCVRQSTSQLLEKMTSKTGKADAGLPTRESLNKLQALATRKLRDIVNKRSADAKNWEGSQSELVAARELLAKADK